MRTTEQTIKIEITEPVPEITEPVPESPEAVTPTEQELMDKYINLETKPTITFYCFAVKEKKVLPIFKISRLNIMNEDGVTIKQTRHQAIGYYHIPSGEHRPAHTFITKLLFDELIQKGVPSQDRMIMSNTSKPKKKRKSKTIVDNTEYCCIYFQAAKEADKIVKATKAAKKRVKLTIDKSVDDKVLSDEDKEKLLDAFYK
ncbi:MAG: hypothetical protein N2B06_04830 [Clostridium sp.]